MTIISDTLKQPSTVMGIATGIGSIAMVVAHVLTHDTTVAMGAGGAAAAIVAIILPDNAAARSSVEKLFTDAAMAVAQKHFTAMLPTLFADTVAVVNSIQAPTAVTTTTTTTGVPT